MAFINANNTLRTIASIKKEKLAELDALEREFSKRQKIILNELFTLTNMQEELENDDSDVVIP